MNPERLDHQSEINNHEEEQTKEKESIEKIEKSSLGASNKIDLMLLILNRKYATYLGNHDIAESEEHKEKLIKEFTEELNNITTLLNDIGLPYEITAKVEDDNEIIGFSLMVAKERDNLDKIVEADKNEDDKTVGLLLGYPKTAVETYNTPDALDVGTELPEEYTELRKEGMLPFLGFAPSKSHWKEELEWARNNKKIIEESSPSTLNEAIEEYEEHIKKFEDEKREIDEHSKILISNTSSFQELSKTILENQICATDSNGHVYNPDTLIEMINEVANEEKDINDIINELGLRDKVIEIIHNKQKEKHEV